jgi:hypothetical protein
MSSHVLFLVVRHVRCAWNDPLVKVWVILDRPPNDPLLRKKEILHQLLTTGQGSNKAFSKKAEHSIPG